MSICDAALDMARRGFYVLPLLPNSKIPFAFNSKEQNCSPRDKVLAGGVNIATRDEDKIRSWFSHPLDPDFGYDGDEINFGVHCIGMTVLDVDVKNGKNGAIDYLELGLMPDTFTVRTPTGGNHFYFSGAEVGQRKLTDAIDIRSRNGYVVGPGSLIDGEAYTIEEDCPLATIPEHIFKRLGKPAERQNLAQVPVTDLDLDGAVRAAEAFLKWERPAPIGNRNNTAFALACQIKDFGISPGKIHELLVQWNDRNEEPLPDDELQAIAENAYNSGRYAPGSRNPEIELGDVPPILSEIYPEKDASEKSSFGLIIQGREPSQIPRRPWIIKDLMLARSLTAIVAEPGARKSTFSVALAVGCSLGRLDFLGLKLLGPPCDVLIVNNEDDEDEIDRRIAAICKVNSLDYHEAKKRIHVYKPESGRPFIAVARHRETKKLCGSARLLEMKGYIKGNNIKLAIFDPLVETHEGAENDNTEMARVMSIYRYIMRVEDIAGIIVHHSRKPSVASSAGYAGEQLSARGASAIPGNVRALATLCHATEDDAYTELGVTPPAHRNYCRLDIGKGSYIPPGAHTRWYRCDSVRVGPDDCDDTAPGMTAIDRSDQQSLLVGAIHAAIRGRRDLFDKEGLMPIKEAAEVVVMDLPETTLEQAQKHLEGLFSVVQEREGVRFVVRKEGKKAWLKAA